MDGARRSPPRFAACLAALAATLCAGLAGDASAQAPPLAPRTAPPMGAPVSGPPMTGPTVSGPLVSGPIEAATEGPCVGCATAVPPLLAQPGSQFAPSGFDAQGPTGPWQTGPSPRPWLLRQFDLRHSSTHGRAMGPGEPLRGTSWLNRPVSVSLDGGAFLMGDRVSPNVRASNDLFGAIGVGWDWDHYWGTQLRVGWSTPELLNTQQTSAPNDDNLLITDLSLLYYPWGDSRMRPYWRVGVGLTDIEFTNDLGLRNQEMLFTIPIGVGLKYQLRRHIAWRLEFADNIAIGQNEAGAMNNFTITTGFEWRLGGRPDGYWAWAPRGGSW